MAAFSLFDAPGKNGFKYTDAADIESFATAFIMRFFPQENNKNILNSVELATLFHFPDHKNIPTTQLARQASKQVDGPRNMPENGLMLGYNVFRGVKKPIRLSLETAAAICMWLDRRVPESRYSRKFGTSGHACW